VTVRAGGKKSFLREEWLGLLLMALISLALLFMEFHGWFASLEGQAFDLYRRIEYFLSSDNSSNPIVIIAVDDSSYEKCFERTSPLFPEKVMELVTFAVDRGATVVGVDLQTDSPEYIGYQHPVRKNVSVVWAATMKTEPGDLSFGRWLLGQDQELAPDKAKGEQISSEIGFLWGVPAYPEDEDTRIRKLPRAYSPVDRANVNSPPIYTLSRRIAMEYRALKRPHDPLKDDLSEVMVTYGNPRPERVSAGKILGCGESGSPMVSYSERAFRRPDFSLTPNDKLLFKDKIVLIGGTWKDSADFHETSLGRMPGVVIVADSIQAELEDEHVRELPKIVMFAIDLIVGTISLYILWRWKVNTTRKLILVSVGGIVLLFGLGGILLYHLRILWVSWTGAVTGALVGFLVDMWRENPKLEHKSS
jgi:CHASE2 domain-containing sensor protein